MIELFHTFIFFQIQYSTYLLLKLSLNTLLILMTNGCSLHVKALGITDNAVSHSFIHLILHFTCLMSSCIIKN